MIATDLRTAAARHLLGLANTDYLVEVAHAALERGIFARGLGEIVTAKPSLLADVGPHFEWALRELGIRVETSNVAIDLVAKCYMVLLAEGAGNPFEILSRFFRDFSDLQCGRTGRLWRSQLLDACTDLIELYYLYDRIDSELRAVQPPNISEHVEALNSGCRSQARRWCRDRWLPELDGSWLTSTVIALARGICDEHAFDRLPILADAFGDAGCDHAEILEHCRRDSSHVRCCWVVDLVLAKE